DIGGAISRVTRPDPDTGVAVGIARARHDRRVGLATPADGTDARSLAAIVEEGQHRKHGGRFHLDDDEWILFPLGNENAASPLDDQGRRERHGRFLARYDDTSSICEPPSVA